MFSATDLAYVYSGGTDNIDPNESIGGEPSLQRIVGTLDNLFDDISGTEITQGRTDYRCFYVFNDNPTTSLTSSAIAILSQVPGGADVQLGFQFSDDVQKIIVSPTATSGSLIMTWEGQDFQVNWETIPQDWANAIGNAIRKLSGVDDIEVLSESLGNTTSVIVTFFGSKYRELIQIKSNLLVSDTVSVNVAVQKVQDGSPINRIASFLSSSTTAPDGIVFSSPTTANPVLIGTLHPADGFPVWVQRTSPVNVAPIDQDGFTVRIMGVPAVVAPTGSFIYTASGGIVMGGGSDARRVFNTFFYDGNGGIIISGSALAEYSIRTNHYVYTSDGGITISGESLISTNIPRNCFHCCRTGTTSNLYFVQAQSIGTPSTSPDGCISTSDTRTNCGCFALNVGTGLYLDTDSCTWIGGNEYASWVLSQDALTGIWTIEGCANGYTVWAQWDSLNWKCCDTNTYNLTIDGLHSDNCAIHGEVTSGVQATISVCAACLIDDGVSTYPSCYDPNGMFDYCASPPCRETPDSCDISLQECDGYCCLPSEWLLALSSLPSECSAAANPFVLVRSDGCTWKGTAAGVTFTLAHTAGTWTLSSSGAAVLTSSVSDASFKACDVNTIHLVCSANPGASPIATLTPVDCLNITNGGGVTISGCSIYESLPCVACDSISQDHWPVVYFTGFSGLPGDWHGVSASPGDIFPIYVNRIGGTNACTCSVEAVTQPDCGTTLRLTSDNCLHNDYGPTSFSINLNCNQLYASGGVQICGGSGSGKVVFCLRNPVGCTIDPNYSTFTVTVS